MDSNPGIQLGEDFEPVMKRAGEVNAVPGGDAFREFASAALNGLDLHVETIVEDWHFLSATLFVGHLLDDYTRIPRKLRVELIARVAAEIALACAMDRARSAHGS